MTVCKLPSALTIGYDEAGSGPPLLLLHAFPLDRGVWAPQLSALSDVVLGKDLEAALGDIVKEVTATRRSWVRDRPCSLWVKVC